MYPLVWIGRRALPDRPVEAVPQWAPRRLTRESWPTSAERHPVQTVLLPTGSVHILRLYTVRTAAELKATRLFAIFLPEPLLLPGARRCDAVICRNYRAFSRRGLATLTIVALSLEDSRLND